MSHDDAIVDGKHKTQNLAFFFHKLGQLKEIIRILLSLEVKFPFFG